MSKLYTTSLSCPVKLSENISDILVRENLTPYVHISSTFESKYWDRGILKPVLENRLSFLTQSSKIISLQRRIAQIHPYQNPRISLLGYNRITTASKAPILKSDYKLINATGYRATSIIFLQDGKILLVRRGPTSPWMPGSWTLVTGSIYETESPYQGAIREAQEEVSLNPLKLKSIGVGRSPGEDIVHFFLCTKFEGEVLLNYENDLFAWVGLDTIQIYNMPRLQSWFARQALKSFNNN